MNMQKEQRGCLKPPQDSEVQCWLRHRRASQDLSFMVLGGAASLKHSMLLAKMEF